MGQNPNPRPQPPKAAPAPTRGDGEGPPGGDGDTIDFCLMTHPVQVSLLPGAPAQIGDPVTLGLGSPPTVNAGPELIGTLSDGIAQALGRCLIDGFRLTGKIDEIDLEGRIARITVSGEPAET